MWKRLTKLQRVRNVVVPLVTSQRRQYHVAPWNFLTALVQWIGFSEEVTRDQQQPHQKAKNAWTIVLLCIHLAWKARRQQGAVRLLCRMMSVVAGVMNHSGVVP